MDRNNKIDYILKILSKIMLYYFVAMICLVAILYMVYPSNYAYEVVPAGINGDYYKQTSDLKVISYEEHKELKRTNDAYVWTAFICISGMILCNPDTWKKLRGKNNDEKD